MNRDWRTDPQPGDLPLPIERTLHRPTDSTVHFERITAPKSASIRALAGQSHLQLGLFDACNLLELMRGQLMFADTDQQAKATRDPVAPAKRSAPAQARAASHMLDDGTPAHGLASLLAELSTVVRNTCRTPAAGPDAPTFEVHTTPNARQERALGLTEQIHP
jgi:hypothetical protein